MTFDSVIFSIKSVNANETAPKGARCFVASQQVLFSVFYAQIKHARLIWIKSLNATSFHSETKFDLA